MVQVSCVVVGNESLLVQCAEIMLERGNTIAAVVTRNPDIRTWAEGRNLRVEAYGADLAQRLSDAPFDVLLSIANLSVIPEDVLALPRKAAINFHDGPLPRHAGLNAPVWALIEGETQHGISWHLMQGGVDEGDILVSRSFDITATDTALTLNTKAYEAAIASFPSLMDQIEGDLTPVAQDLSQRSYHALTDRPEGLGLLDFTQPAATLERLVRALDHGAYWNPLCVPKIQGDELFRVGSARLTESHAAPGTVIDLGEDHLTVACGGHALVLTGLTRLCGSAVAPKDVAQFGQVLVGETATLRPDQRETLARHDGFWRRRLADLIPIAMTGVADVSGPIEIRDLGVSADLADVAIWAARLSGQGRFDLAYANTAVTDLAQSGTSLSWVPLRVDALGTASDLREAFIKQIEIADKKGAIARDLPLRAPDLSWPTTPEIGLGETHIPGTVLTFGTTQVSFDSGRISEAEVDLLVARLALLAGAQGAVADLTELPQAERDLVVDHWNQTATKHDTTLTMHRAFEAQVAKTPDATALVFENQSLSYSELNRRANRAAHLLREMGVQPGVVVGLCCNRSIEMMVGALAILKAGGAYLPMDPSYPPERLQHFVEDSGATVIVTTARCEPNLPPHTADLLVLDAEPRLATASSETPDGGSTPEDLAYLIYTSGSTGKPKGVMVEHRNVVNFYAGMDAHIAEHGGTWLAVTSLSFDISVLELFWTTARGFKVVLSSDEDRGLISNGALPSGQGMDFSIYYWGNDDGIGRDKYSLLLEGAKFADENGFCAVWTPERHFHAFGGPYPNPSVTGAAVAAVTKNIGVRAGSVVAPLHHPARIAEEWAVIDNLTNGRAGMAIASGWQPDDFVLRPENTPPNNKPAMTQNIDQIRRLWRGEAVGFPRQDGSLHDVVTQPRPVSKELPIWVTTAGNPKTWEEAGTLGCNVLTHLLGQSMDEVAGKIAIYHNALRAAGHDPKDFSVTLMLHTFISDSRDHAREIARGPMKDYLNSAAGLIKQYAWAFPAFKRPEGVNNAFDLQLDGLEPDELDAILDFAFERYFNDSGLFGTVEDAVARAEELKKIGVTEIACLVDYGIDRDQVLEGLKPLAQVVKASNTAQDLAEDDFSIAAQIVRHDVTHLQCTPSMARMIAMNDEARFALGGVSHLYFGGEPLPGALVEEFGQITKATITNMYGPTETTIWSSVETPQHGEAVVNIGYPIANTQLYVLDPARNPVGVGQEGELWIGGDGVTRGYWNRPELTAERFAENLFHAGRMYATGDLVRRRIDGKISFVGRVDHQVKLRGHRIELGEIEAVLEAQTGVTQAVVIAREDQPGDTRLVGYFTGTGTEAALKSALSSELPAIMVPSRFIALEVFPLTPNKKVDRKALPAPTVPKAAPVPRAAPVVTPQTTSGDGASIVPRVAQIWTTILGVQDISARDNFFDLGGHSLLAVQAHRAIREELGAKTLSITDIFRFPVLGDLANRIAAMVEGGAAPKPATPAAAPSGTRAQSRTDAMARRREMRARRRA